MSFSRQHFAVVRLATDVSLENSTTDGILSLTRDSKHFFIHWCPFACHPKSTLIEMLNDQSDYLNDEWAPNSIINVDCQILTKIEISPNPLKITLYRLNSDETRTLLFKPENHNEFTILIEKLILNGICVPSNESEFCLHFNKNCKIGYFNTISPELQLDYSLDVNNFSSFWEKVHNFFVDFMNFVQTHYHSPLKDYPLDVGARSCNTIFTSKINEFYKTLPIKYERVTKENYTEVFDEEGRIKDFKLLKERFYFAGVDKDLIHIFLPFLCNLYPSNSTEKERQEINVKLRKSYDRLNEMVQLVQEYQVVNNKKLSCSYRVISHDVLRTDRHHPAFKENDGPGLTLLTKILHAYNVYNPCVNYVQGMNDLFVPILDAFIREWDEKGNPIDENGEIMDIDKIDHIMFWCYAHFLEVTNHTDFLPLVSEQCKNMSLKVMEVLKDVSPAVAIWLEAKNLTELIWCYTDYVLLFKRSFQQILPVWMNIISAPDPCEWITHFAASLIIASFDELSKMPNVAITDILATFPNIIQSLDVNQISRSANYISSFYTKKFYMKRETQEEFHSDFFPVPTE